MEILRIEDFILMKPQSIKKIKQKTELYDIEVDEINNFFIKINNCYLLSHNCDGNHITALLMNLFARWFPDVLKKNKLYKLIMPLISYDENKERHYEYNLDNNEYKTKKNLRYLKGVGSMDKEDWKFIFKDMNLVKIKTNKKSDKYLDVVFGSDVKYRKNWLKVEDKEI